ncbi:MAG TPA: DUF4192 domain-containing protein [Jatrophihabitans sp.]|jgi:hypothetical protein|uniref:DUF4192 domain-containing protein n=1 Tax=Jatrophihabitans sp. TaxID=1932789 RepID=UPI002E0763CB|nr:DUF4192 domain-containing protein [Jatrophihabitans sp.]
MTTTDKPALRITGPADLISAVPYLLGFHPQDSLVLIGLADSHLVVTARLDLDALTSQVLTDTIGAIVRGGTTDLIAAVYTNAQHPTSAADLPQRSIIEQVSGVAESSTVTLIEGLLVTADRWWSYSCESPACCPPDGRPFTATTVFQTEAVVAGLTVVPTREALADMFAAVPDRPDLAELIARHEHLELSAALNGSRDAWARSVTRALFVAHRGAQDGRMPTDEDVARYGVGLQSYAVRDAMWMGVDDGRLAGIDLWVNLARRLPSPHDAAPLFLAAWSAFRDGNGALAGIAATKALESDPGYSAADLLLAALAHGIDPRSLPRLRATKGDKDTNQ